MSPNDVQTIADLVRARSGLILTPDKSYLIESRLAPLARREAIASVADLIGKIRTTKDERLCLQVVDALTTNETFFFRDKSPFDLFRNIIVPELRAKRGAADKLRLWSAACSTGQEPYSLAMTMDELRQSGKGAELEILGTDISDRVIARAKEGIYSQFEVQRGLPVQLLLKHFTQVGDQWKISDALKSKVLWRKFNLLDDPRSLGRFDIVFCRNVLIYFDQPTKARVLEGIARVLAPDGYLVMGAAETVLGVSNAFEPHPTSRGLYRPTGQSRAAA